MVKQMSSETKCGKAVSLFFYKAVPVINALPAIQPPIAVCYHLVKMLPCLKPLVLLGMQLMSVNILMLLN